MSQLAYQLRGIRGERVALTSVSVTAVLHDLLAEVTMCQAYRNEEQGSIEAVYTFPLPLDAVLLELQVELGGRVLKGVVVEKKAAEEKYEDAVAAGDAAVMLEQLEPGLYTMNVGNLLPGESAVITFTWSILYRWAGERLRLFIPTTVGPRFGNSPHAPHQAPESSLEVENRFSLRMEIFGALRDAQFTCPSHQVSFTRLAEKLVIELSQPQAAPLTAMDRDFVLGVKALKASRSFALSGVDGDGVAAVASFQPFFPGFRQPRPLNLLIVVDCSGSMQGASIEQAKKALEGILDALEPADSVALIAFGNSTHALWDQLTECTAANRATARHFASQLAANMGGTEIAKALLAAYRVIGETAAAEILLVTDGLVNQWKPVVDQARASGHRIFTVGVGTAVSEAFVRELAARTGGECELVAPREDMADRIVRHFERMRAPRARRVVVQWPEGASGVAPSTLGAVFDGDTVVSSARFPSGQLVRPVALEIETETGETFRQELTIPAPQPPAEGQISTVARFAASLRLRDLDALAGLTTALRYRLVSPYTNWLVVAERPEGLKAHDIPALRKVPQTIHAGIGFSGRLITAAAMGAPAAPAAAMRHPGQAFTSLFQRAVPEIAPPFFGSALKEIMLIGAVPPDEWLRIAQWAARLNHTELAKQCDEIVKKQCEEIATKMRIPLNEAEAHRRLTILRTAHRLGFKLTDAIVQKARKLAIDLDA
jgi:Ca-activated chloride channel family protein